MLGSHGVNFLGSEVWFRVRSNDVIGDSFGARQHIGVKNGEVQLTAVVHCRSVAPTHSDARKCALRLNNSDTHTLRGVNPSMV